MEKLTKHNIISTKWKFRNNKKRNKRKYLKIWDDQIKQLIETKKISYKNGWIQRLEDKLEYNRTTALAKREVRRRQRLSWDKFVTNLDHKTYKTQPKVYKNFKTN